jgi:hypothetical protein
MKMAVFWDVAPCSLVVLTDVSKMSVFWDVAPCSLVDIDRRFKDVCLLGCSNALSGRY